MATIISYTNHLDESITKQQFDGIAEKCIVYTEDNSVKKIERMEYDVIKRVTYYLSEGELINSVLAMFGGLSVEIINRSVIGDYFLEENNEYNITHELVFFTKQLFGQSGNLICTQDYDISSLAPILNSTEKYLFDDPRELWVLGFDYNDDGSINYIWGDWVENTDQRQKGVIYNDKISVYFPTLLTDHPYYTNSDLLPLNNV
jgi:hypothetical protein